MAHVVLTRAGFSRKLKEHPAKTASKGATAQAQTMQVPSTLSCTCRLQTGSLLCLCRSGACMSGGVETGALFLSFLFMKFLIGASIRPQVESSQLLLKDLKPCRIESPQCCRSLMSLHVFTSLLNSLMERLIAADTCQRIARPDNKPSDGWLPKKAHEFVLNCCCTPKYR